MKTFHCIEHSCFGQIASLGWEARTWHRRCRTRVRRGGTRRRTGDAAACASGRVVPRGSHVVFIDARRREPTRLRRARKRAESGLNRPYRPKQPIKAEIKKKKKKNPERTVLLNTNPTSAQFHSKRQNTLLTFHLTHFVSVLSASVSSPSLPLCIYFISLAASIHSFFSSLSHILNSGIIIKLSILV